QTYFEEPLPSAEAVDEAFTFHAFEIEEREGDLMDVKVLPDRAGYALSHRGIAKELSAILNMSMKRDPLREALPTWPATSELKVEIEDPKKCSRYTGAVVKGVKVGPSPAWLQEALASVGQRSINNVVDATNYVMLNIGQPLHAFDAGKLDQCFPDRPYAITVRGAHEGEKITALSGEEYVLPEGIMIIVDEHGDQPLAVAGVKGGVAAQVDEKTTDLVVEAASFDGPTVRRAAQRLKLFTDASLRFQNKPSPELAAYGMRDVLALITEIAGGEVEGVVDVYPAQAVQAPHLVSVTLEKINGVLGSKFEGLSPIEDVFARRLGFETKVSGNSITILPPFERSDIVISEDLVEEVVRILGYEHVPSMPLPQVAEAPDQARFRGIEKVKDFLVERGFTEISTQAFAKKGDISLANPLDKGKPALRTTLAKNMEEALTQARHYAPRVLPPNAKPKLFEIGTVFTKEGEKLVVETSEPVADLPTIAEDAVYVPKRYALSAYKPFSAYPFMLRDIAVWVGGGAGDPEQSEGHIKKIIQENAGELLVRMDQFDRFEKEGRVSYAFRLVFESSERTLTDEEVNGIMEKISAALRAAGYEVR
ncbi:MAG TPA: phenylalanine--tRNA ligase subunit beta, partial [Candidatus Paceibacterota bacterium]